MSQGRGHQARPLGPEHRTRQELTEAAPVATGSGMVLKPRDPRLDRGRTGALEVQKEATQSKGRQTSPATGLRFAFHAWLFPWSQAPTPLGLPASLAPACFSSQPSPAFRKPAAQEISLPDTSPSDLGLIGAKREPGEGVVSNTNKP